MDRRAARPPVLTRLLAGFILSGCGLALPSPARPQPAPGPLPGSGEAPVARLLVRSGDPAPGTARLGAKFSCALAATPDGDLLFTDGAGTALFRRSGAGIGVAVHTGDPAPGGGRIGAPCEAAAGSDGTIALRAELADGRTAILRLEPRAGSMEEVIARGASVTLRDGPATVGYLGAPAVDGAGAVLVAVAFLEGPEAILRLEAGRSPEVLMQSGEPFAGGFILGFLADPAVNAGGTVALEAAIGTNDGSQTGEVVATAAPGGAGIVLFQISTLPGQPARALAGFPAAINDAGRVAFLWFDAGRARLQLVTGGSSATIVANGVAAPGGGTFTDIALYRPAIDAGGKVLFGARRSGGTSGIFLAGATLALVAEEPAGGPGLSPVAPMFAPDGRVIFASRATAYGSGIFAKAGNDVVALVRAGDAIAAPRFATLLDTAPALATALMTQLPLGPALAPGGRMIFDARVTGGLRGLYERDRTGGIAPVALDGDEAGAGRLNGESFAFHSIDGSGTAAFLATTSAGLSGAADWAVYERPAGGVLVRILGVGDREPAGGGRTIAALRPPSRLNSAGRLVLPALLSDGSTVLYGYDGRDLFRIAGSGDPAPGGARFVSLDTGSGFQGTHLPPALTDEGDVLFGALTDAWEVALFSARCEPGGGVIERILGQGTGTDIGPLTPFELQALEADGRGRVAFEAAYNDDIDFGTFLSAGAGIATLARRFDLVGDLGFVLRVDPQLALAGPDSVAWGLDFFDGSQAIVLGTGDRPDPLDATVVASTGGAAPDGGAYRFFRVAFRTASRLAGDGLGTLAFAAATDAGPQGIFAYGAPPDSAPAADAGPDLYAECAGPGGTPVTLDGAASSDPDGDPLRYLWTGPFGTVEGARPTVTLPPGSWPITLLVDDGTLVSEPDTVVVTVRDTLAPEISARATPALLWPPNGRTVEVGVEITVADRCDASPRVTLLDATSSEAGVRRGGGSPILGADLGTDDRLVSLRADRFGTGPGRTYTLVYRAVDGSGNAAAATATVVVPHDRGDRDRDK
jgi:hypothetical protein